MPFSINGSGLRWRPLEGEQGHTVYYKPFQASMARATGTKVFGARIPDFLFGGPVSKKCQNVSNTRRWRLFLVTCRVGSMIPFPVTCLA